MATESEIIAVFSRYTYYILRALATRNVADSVKYTTDLLYYASLTGTGDKYIRLLDTIFDRLSRLPESFRERYVDHLDRKFDMILRGNEAVFVKDLVERAVMLKIDRFEKYRDLWVSREEVEKEASKIVEEVFKGE